MSENITVRSITGRFLEHSRIFYFENAGLPEIYCGSADWMPRNLDKRVEILFPVEDPVLKKDIVELLNIQLSDTKKARLMKPDGHYERVDMRGKKAVSAQETFQAMALKNR